MSFKKRTHTCNELCKNEIGKTVTLNGWVDRRRDLGGVIFIELRDRYGITQIVFNPTHSKSSHDVAKNLRSEFVISVTGRVEKRPDGTENKNFPTGEIDLLADEIEILNSAETPPFAINEETNANEDLRLKYRYLDLRRNELKNNMILRHKMYQVVRKYFDANNFLEVETPILMKSTPEGARDFLVPSRIQEGKFYALPQSPQTYKQILMVAGLDKYFQIVKCFRDEDLRADRQPEFTQIDVEMSFIDEESIYKMVEDLMKKIFMEIMNVEIKFPIERISYKTAIEKYGSDKPDLRFDLPIETLTETVRDCPFKLFSETANNGGVVAGIKIENGSEISRSQIDGLTDFVKKLGAGGLIWARVTENGIQSPTEKHITKEYFEKIANQMNAKIGDLILILFGEKIKTYSWLGNLRLELAKRNNLIKNNIWKLLWVTDFPLFDYSEEEKRYIAMHHPFTSPNFEDLHLLDTKPNFARARAYDLVLNGNEIAGGSIRIHNSDLQSKIFSLLGISDEEAKQKFGFLLDAFKFGAPPHGGIAFGFDRIAMLLCNANSIRDVIAFPKTSSGTSLMDDAPSFVDKKQLDELHIKLK